MSKPNYVNPVIEIYKDRKIYTYNQIVLRVSPEALKKIIDGVEETGLSIVQLLAHSSKPCDCCRNKPVNTLDSNSNPVQVNRGLLYESIKTRYGSYNKKKDINEQSD